tara:strand:- start:470 stop:1312 length:843 start_codon:yes stop_codon:yes gene_type:complete
MPVGKRAITIAMVSAVCVHAGFGALLLMTSAAGRSGSSGANAPGSASMSMELRLSDTPSGPASDGASEDIASAQPADPPSETVSDAAAEEPVSSNKIIHKSERAADTAAAAAPARVAPLPKVKPGRRAKPVQAEPSASAPQIAQNAVENGSDTHQIDATSRRVASLTEPAAAGPAHRDSAGSGIGFHPDYMATLTAWLEEHKRYPRRARLRGQQGTVLLSFEIARNGALLSYRIARSSGHLLLDDSVRSLIERASPLPPPPDSSGKDRSRFSIPIVFRIN